MNLAISNIAWPPSDKVIVYELLSTLGVQGVEFAPGLLFDQANDAFLPDGKLVDQELRLLAEFDLKLVSMQSLLFGCEGAFLFGRSEERARFKGQMLRAIRLAGSLGVPNIVFGSPTNRIVPKHMSDRDAEQIAMEVFGELGDVARDRDVQIAMEPNPVQYGANFLVTLDQAAGFVQTLGHPAVRLNFDLGALAMCDQSSQLEAYFSQYFSEVSHIHVSGPNLQPAPESRELAERVCSLAERHAFQGWISIEMRRQEGDWLQSLRTCLRRLVDGSGGVNHA